MREIKVNEKCYSILLLSQAIQINITSIIRETFTLLFRLLKYDSEWTCYKLKIVKLKNEEDILAQVAVGTSNWLVEKSIFNSNTQKYSITQVKPYIFTFQKLYLQRNQSLKVGCTKWNIKMSLNWEKSLFTAQKEFEKCIVFH